MRLLVHNSGNEASQSHHKDSHLGSCRATVGTGAMGKPSCVPRSRMGTRRGVGGRGGLCPQVHVHSIESLCLRLRDNPDSCPTSPSSRVFFAVIFSFDEKVMIFLHQCRKTRAVTSSGFEFLDSSSPTLTSGFPLGNGVCLGWRVGGGLMSSDSPWQQACDSKAPTGPPGAGHPPEGGSERRAVNQAVLRVRL